jgi:hypothetical protein
MEFVELKVKQALGSPVLHRPRMCRELAGSKSMLNSCDLVSLRWDGGAELSPAQLSAATAMAMPEFRQRIQETHLR